MNPRLLVTHPALVIGRLAVVRSLVALTEIFRTNQYFSTSRVADNEYQTHQNIWASCSFGRSDNPNDLAYFKQQGLDDKIINWCIWFCRTTRNIPEFKVQPELALELLMAANFLDT